MAVSITWMAHATFKVNDGALIYIDPWKLQVEDRADIVLITHAHYDHCSPEDVSKVAGEETVIIGPAECASEFLLNFRPAVIGSKLTVGDVEITPVSAYNIDKEFHPKNKKWVGYVIEIDGKRVYHAGDTDSIPEMKKLKGLGVDVALLPVGGTYTMTAEEAAEAANAIEPKLAIPMHFGTIVGGTSDAEQFRQLCRVPVEVLEPGSAHTL
jgi:L-ascorbate metabolism protein UlaG (beta-lactamase superfamily)